MDFNDINRTKQKLIDFERRIADHYEAGRIRAPIHLAHGNEEPLIHIFKDIKPEDWIFSTYRSHYLALLKGIPESWLEQQILAGKSMQIMNKDYRFVSSAIVGGHLPMAVGTAMAIKIRGEPERVWAFCGDMAAETGVFHECQKYAQRKNLPLTFVIEDNAMSVDTPTQEVWGNEGGKPNVLRYSYKREVYPHHGSGKWIPF